MGKVDDAIDECSLLLSEFDFSVAGSAPSTSEASLLSSSSSSHELDVEVKNFIQNVTLPVSALYYPELSLAREECALMPARRYPRVTTRSSHLSSLQIVSLGNQWAQRLCRHRRRTHLAIMTRNPDFGCSPGRQSKAPTAQSVLVRVYPLIHPRLVGPSGTYLQGREAETEKEWDQNRGQDICILLPSPYFGRCADLEI